MSSYSLARIYKVFQDEVSELCSIVTKLAALPQNLERDVHKSQAHPTQRINMPSIDHRVKSVDEILDILLLGVTRAFHLSVIEFRFQIVSYHLVIEL